MKKAFSIVELIIVIAVIGILAAILIPVFSNIIEKANAKSALSDAKNTLTNYVAHCESNQRSKQDTCIIVEKAKAYYAFGYFVSMNELIESNHNPYKADSLQDAITKLKNTEVIISLGSDSKEITATLPEVPDNVLVYEGYSLQPIGELVTLDKEQLGLCIDESHTLSATLFPERQGLSLTWESADESIAAVKNGEVVGISKGETEVTVRYGDVLATCNVVVDEFVEFSGNMAELKTLIENDNSAVYIKLMDDVYLVDYPDIFPIVIPENKVVRLDFNRKYISYSHSSAQNCIYAMFINDGGQFSLESSGAFKDGAIYMGSDNTPDYDTSGYIIENRNGGLLNVVNDIQIVIMDSTTSSTQAIHNTNGLVIMNKNSRISVHGSFGYGIYNDVNGRLIVNSVFSIGGADAGIINYGVVEAIKGGMISSVRNYGLIKEISGGEFRGDIAIENIGKNAVIGRITGGIFGSNVEENTVADSATALLLKDGSTIGAITGGTYYGTETIVCDESSTITQGIYGGKFRTQVPARLLAKGKTCTYNESIKMFVVE